MGLIEELEEEKLKNFVRQHSIIADHLNAITQKYGDYDVEVFLETYNGLKDALYKIQKKNKLSSESFATKEANKMFSDDIANSYDEDYEEGEY
jgi:hypothetical protein